MHYFTRKTQNHPALPTFMFLLPEAISQTPKLKMFGDDTVFTSIYVRPNLQENQEHWEIAKEDYQTLQIDIQWKRMHSQETCECKGDESAFGIEQKEKRNSHGKDPRTKVGTLVPLKKNSQGEDPRTFKEPVERCRVQEKQKEEKWKKKKKKQAKKKNVKYRKRSLWNKCKERIGRFLTAKERQKE